MSTVETLIQNIMSDNYKSAGDVFNDLINDKMNVALEQEKANVAGSIYNPAAENSDEDI